MPILEERMLRLVQAAEAYQAVFLEAIHILESNAKLVITKQMTAQEALTDTQLQFQVLKVQHGPATIIIEERTRFALNHNRNQREKKRAEAKRRRLHMNKQLYPATPPTRWVQEDTTHKQVIEGIRHDTPIKPISEWEQETINEVKRQERERGERAPLSPNVTVTSTTAPPPAIDTVEGTNISLDKDETDD